VTLEIPQHDALNLWLAMLAGDEPEGGLLELRAKRHGGTMRRVGFYPVHERPQIMAAIVRAARLGDIYAGVAPRRERPDGSAPTSGGVEAIERVWTLFVDADTDEAAEALRTFEPAAAILIRSGTGVHGYWPLREPLSPEHAKRANRRLAHHLAADMNATDAARIMRPPGTLNWKHTPPRRVVCERLEILSYTAAGVVGRLPDPPAAPRREPQALPAGPGSANAALQGAARVVREAQPGNRNASLNWAAWALGQRIAARELDEKSVRAELHAAAAEAGLDDTEIDVTLASGLRAGLAA
jgi:hypothetical protein